MPTKAYKTASAVSFSLKTFTVLNSESYILSAVFVLFSCCFGKQSATREAVDQKEQEVARLKPSQLDFQTLKKGLRILQQNHTLVTREAQGLKSC